MKRSIAVNFLLVTSTVMAFAQSVSFSSNDLKLTITAEGKVSELIDISNNKNYVQGNSTAILSLMMDKQIVTPSAMTFNKEINAIDLSFANGATATVTILSKKTHLSLELTALNSKNYVEAVVWGPRRFTEGGVRSRGIAGFFRADPQAAPQFCFRQS